MKVELINNIEDFKDLKAQWEELLSTSSAKSIFLSWEWLYHWWTNFGTGRELYILLVKDSINDVLIGIVPLFKESVRVVGVAKIDTLRFLGADEGASDFLDFICQPGYEEKFLWAVHDFLKTHKGEWDLIEFSEVDGDSHAISRLKAAVLSEFWLLETRSQTCPYLKLPQSFGQLGYEVSTKLLKNLRWAEKQLMIKMGAVFSVNDEQSSIEEKIDTLFKLHKTRFSHKENNVSSFAGDRIKKFHLAVAESFDKAGRLRFYSIKIGNETIACLYAFRYKDRVFYYQTGYNPEFGKYSVGTVVLSFAIKSAIEEGASEFHFLRGEEPYKVRWTKEKKLTKRLCVLKKDIPGSLFFTLLRARYALSAFKNQIFRHQKDES